MLIDQNEAAASPGSDEATVGKWRQRFVGRRMDGLRDEARAGAVCTIDVVLTETVIVKTLKSVSANAPYRRSPGLTTTNGYRPQAFGVSGVLLNSGPAAWKPSMRGPNGPSLRATAILDLGGSSFRLVTTEI
ncbi:helix-turn-helix domain-containing protein [Bradyrhizobium diazoefficiens]|nr:helix-turn-helix domain-containing protein [Bradyrhizobium diazoefficiens]QQN62259.1 helix-turn-helix domain-containing protein [Bradyrhizobium diazoefficiens]